MRSIFFQVIGHRGFQGLEPSDIGEDEAKAFPLLEQRQPPGLEPRVVVLVEIVDAEHLFAAVEQRVGDMKSNEAGGAGDQNRHQKSLPDLKGART